MRRWANSGRIAIVRTPGGKRLYSITDIRGIFGDNQTQPTQKAKICYARVSSEHQRGDLKRQIANLQQHYPEHEIISDIGSGLNWKRKGLLPFWNEYTQEESKKWWLPKRFEFNYLFALIYYFFILLTFLLGPIVPFWIRACGMDL